MEKVKSSPKIITRRNYVGETKTKENLGRTRTDRQRKRERRERRGSDRQEGRGKIHPGG